MFKAQKESTTKNVEHNWIYPPLRILDYYLEGKDFFTKGICMIEIESTGYN